MNDGDGAARHVVLARSSLQFLLAAALAEDLRRRGAGPSRLIFLPDVLDPALFERVVAGWHDMPFDRAVFVAPHRRAGATQALRSSGAVRAELRAGLHAARPASITVFNDREEAGQLLLAEAARHFPAATRRCAEDGALAYTGFTYRAHGRLSALRERLRVGRGWADVRVLGTHPLVQEYVALHPALLRPELRGPKVRQLPTEALNAASLRAAAAAFCRETGFDAGTIPSGAALLTLSHSSYAQRNPDYAQRLAACVDTLAAAGTPLFVKHHPREAAADPLGLAARMQEIPRTLPAECLWMLLRDRPLQVIGGMSTALLTAALLMPQARVGALRHASGSGDSWDAALLAALRIADAP